MFRIAYVISTLAKCGPVNVLFDIVKNLPPEYTIAIFTLAEEPDNTKLPDFAELGIKIVKVCSNRIESAIFGKSKLRSALDDFVPDVVHAHGFRAYLLVSGLIYPKLATVHNCIGDDFMACYPSMQASWMTFSEVRALKRFDQVVSCSSANREFLLEQYGLDTISIRNGVDQTIFYRPSDDIRMLVRAQLGIPDTTFIFISSGGCKEQKGTLLQIEAFKQAKKTLEMDAQLHIFGEGPQFEECQDAADESVVLHGFSSEISKWLQIANCYSSISLSEGMPLAVLEAVSCGCSLMLSAIPPHCEIVKEMPSSDFLICENFIDKNEVCLAFQQAYSKFQARSVFDPDVFSADRMANAYTKIYKDLGCVGQ